MKTFSQRIKDGMIVTVTTCDEGFVINMLKDVGYENQSTLTVTHNHEVARMVHRLLGMAIAHSDTETAAVGEK